MGGGLFHEIPWKALVVRVLRVGGTSCVECTHVFLGDSLVSGTKIAASLAEVAFLRPSPTKGIVANISGEIVALPMNVGRS